MNHQFTIDTASPTSLVGAKLFKSIYESYPESISSQFLREESTKTFQFGGGETTRSLGKFTFPIHLMDEDNNIHSVNLGMEVVEQDIIMLLGANSLSKGSAILDIGNLNITFPEAFGSTVRFPINYADSGHFTMNFYSLAMEDGYEAAQTYLTNTEWNSDSASSLINYVKFNNRVKRRTLAASPVYMHV